MNKRELRQKYLKKRKALSEDAYLTANQKIKFLFFEKFVIEPNATVHVFLPIVENKEVPAGDVTTAIPDDRPRPAWSDRRK